MTVRVVELAAEQYDVVAAWQLRRAGATRRVIEHCTRHQRWMAATLTAPGSVLSHASAAACWARGTMTGRTR